ncbi:hypothetical protein [Pantoea sp. B65]|uniref:hypothetical protein n=1 Tax=Pantoea sp. B65 TaxID=2813359 RepID=UPI0039B6C5C5
MKIHNIIVASLAVTSFSALAFKSEPSTTATLSANQLNAIETSFFKGFNISHSGASLAGTCSASPVTGCSCAFCTMLRSHQN